MFQSQVYFPVNVTLDYDPAADEVYPLWRAPAACEIKSAYAVVANTVAASTADYFSVQLLNGGSAGTGSTAISDAIGGTAGWTGLTPKAFTMTAAGKNLAAGDVVVLSYDETGTGTFGVLNVQLDVQFGT